MLVFLIDLQLYDKSRVNDIRYYNNILSLNTSFEARSISKSLSIFFPLFVKNVIGFFINKLIGFSFTLKMREIFSPTLTPAH